MRRILGAVGVSLLAGGAAALTPFFAALSAALTLTVVTLGISIWRRMRRRPVPGTPHPGSLGGVG